MVMRYDLNERQWMALEPLLPHQGRGRAWRDHRTVLNGILWRLHTGAPWRDVPPRYGAGGRQVLQLQPGAALGPPPPRAHRATEAQGPAFPRHLHPLESA